MRTLFLLAILIGLNVGPASAAPDLAVVDRYTNPDGSVDSDRLRRDYERQRTSKRTRASLAKPAAPPPVRVSPSSLRTEPVRTAVVRPLTANNTVTSTAFLLRQNFSDVYLFTDITETAKAKGAEFSWSRDNVSRDTVLAANGMVAIAFRRLTDEYPLDGSPWLIGVAVAPYVQFQRESHSGLPKQNVDLLTSGGTAEIGFGNVWGGSQYFRRRMAATTDNIKDTTVVHAVAEWLPVYREFGGTVPGTYLIYKFQPELKAQYDSATDGNPLVFSDQRQAFRLGPEATLLFKLHGAEIRISSGASTEKSPTAGRTKHTRNEH